jgi:hypothetical protein
VRESGQLRAIPALFRLQRRVREEPGSHGALDLVYVGIQEPSDRWRAKEVEDGGSEVSSGPESEHPSGQVHAAQSLASQVHHHHMPLPSL